MCVPAAGRHGWACPGGQQWSASGYSHTRVSRVPTVPEEVCVTARDMLLLGPCARGGVQESSGSTRVHEVDALGGNGSG